jgi:hypothetical protein
MVYGLMEWENNIFTLAYNLYFMELRPFNYSLNLFVKP